MTMNGGPARLLRVYGLWILLVTVVVMGAGYGVSMLAPTVYRSAAIVVVEARVRANTTPVAPEMGTEKALAKSGLVVEPAAKTLGVDAGTLGDGLTVTVAPDANVLTFAYDAADAATAQKRAEALAEAYVDYRNAGEAPSTAPAARNAATANANANATLVTPAYLPADPVARPIYIDLGIALVLGLLLGIGTALLRDRMSDRIRGREDFEQITGVTVLATVPRSRRLRGADADRPVLLRAPESPAAESYRYLRSRLQPLLRAGPVTVLVASAQEGEGRSTTAANLALALALAGRTVVLVDADLRRPRLHTMLDRVDELGLTTLLNGESTVAETLQTTPVRRLRLLAAGPGAESAADLLESPRLARVLRTVRQLCDVIVLDSAAVLSVSDAIALAAQSDHVLLVGDYRRTTRAALARALAELHEVVRDDNVSGVLVNAPKSAGGLVPRPRGGAAAPDELRDPLALLDAPDERAAAGRNPVFGSAAVPQVIPGKTAIPASTIYTSSSATPLNVGATLQPPGGAAQPPGGARPPVAAGQPPVVAGQPHIAAGQPHIAAPRGPVGGPVKARANGTPAGPPNGSQVPSPRGGGDGERSLEPRG